jgi:hypothetical protein
VGVDRPVGERRESLDHSGLSTTTVERPKNLNDPNWILNAVSRHLPIHLKQSM